MIELLAIHASACLCNVTTHMPGQANLAVAGNMMACSHY